MMMRDAWHGSGSASWQANSCKNRDISSDINMGPLRAVYREFINNFIDILLFYAVLGYSRGLKMIVEGVASFSQSFVASSHMANQNLMIFIFYDEI